MSDRNNQTTPHNNRSAGEANQVTPDHEDERVTGIIEEAIEARNTTAKRIPLQNETTSFSPKMQMGRIPRDYPQTLIPANRYLNNITKWSKKHKKCYVALKDKQQEKEDKTPMTQAKIS